MKQSSLILAVLLVVACDKEADTQVPEADSVDAAAPAVPQEPDPPELEQAAHEYVLGHYDEVIDMLAPLYADLKERHQYRASGLAGGWLAVAHAKLVFEDGEEPARHAMAMADQTQDPEVRAIAELARGSILMGNEEYVQAKEAFAAAAGAAPATLAGAIANTLLAESLIGTAFGSSTSDVVERPEDLEAAKAAYEATSQAAAHGVESDILTGRVEEGLAAIARYQRDKDGVCSHTQAAVERFKAASASEFLLDGPTGLAADYGCEWVEPAADGTGD